MPGSTDLTELLVGPVLEVAPRLLGAVLRHDGVAVRITEVEAYDGPNDPGSHAHRGRTERNAVMFGPPGRLYVYFTYGMHHCCNVVTGQTGTPSAVLLRAGEVVDGLDQARARRPRSSERDLARGPARLCRALDLTREHDGAELAGGPLTLVPGPPVASYQTGPRVGLRGAPERPWRFWLPGERTVSAYRPAAPLPPRADPV
ncbi:MAG: DNA-3-methyladenine glycosylase [Nocardioides sp.]